MTFRLLDILPAPQSVSFDAAGVDLSDGGMKCVLLERYHGELRPILWLDESFPPGLIEGGVVKDPEVLGKYLGEIFKKHHIKSVALSVPEEQGYLIRFPVPGLTENDVDAGVELQLEEHVPLSPGEAIYDFEIIGRASGKNEFDVAVAVLPRTVVEGYARAFEVAGVSLISIEIEAQATARAVLDLHDTATTLVVDFGHTRTGLSIVSDGSVWFSSVVKLGGHNLTALVAKQFNLDLAEAERLKDKTGLYRSEGDKDLYPVLVTPIIVLKDEILRYISFWKSRADGGRKEGSTIERVVLSGGSSNLLGLADYLSHGLGLPVDVADPWKHAFSYDSFVPEIPLSLARGYITAIGLALRQYDEHKLHVHSL